MSLDSSVAPTATHKKMFDSIGIPILMSLEHQVIKSALPNKDGLGVMPSGTRRSAYLNLPNVNAKLPLENMNKSKPVVLMPWYLTDFLPSQYQAKGHFIVASHS